MKITAVEARVLTPNPYPFRWKEECCLLYTSPSPRD